MDKQTVPDAPEQSRDGLPEYVEGEPSICEPCAKPIYRGQIVQHWEDLGTVHAHCADPFAIPPPNIIDEGGPLFVMLGSPMIYHPIAALSRPSLEPSDADVERVARALCAADGSIWRTKPDVPAVGMHDYDFETLNNHWRHKARAAIASLHPIQNGSGE